ncbi:hypothetical protein HDU67_003101 [Dinochytrium kinnereticum]|nr:hypothetical protein HDU67_003101 [Dinochytrium kinnereticum]
MATTSFTKSLLILTALLLHSTNLTTAEGGGMLQTPTPRGDNLSMMGLSPCGGYNSVGAPTFMGINSSITLTRHLRDVTRVTVNAGKRGGGFQLIGRWEKEEMRMDENVGVDLSRVGFKENEVGVLQVVFEEGDGRVYYQCAG